MLQMWWHIVYMFIFLSGTSKVLQTFDKIVQNLKIKYTLLGSEEARGHSGGEHQLGHTVYRQQRQAEHYQYLEFYKSSVIFPRSSTKSCVPVPICFYDVV